MNKETFFTFLRAVLTAGGAFLFGHNILTTTIDQSLWQEIVGAVMAVGGAVWGIVDKTTTIEAVQSALRSFLSVGGGILVASGRITGEKLEAIGGALAAVITFAYSITSKQKTELIANGTLRPYQNSITNKVGLKKVGVIFFALLISAAASSQSLFKPIPKPTGKVSLVGVPLTQNNIRPLAGVTASLFGDGSQLAGGIGVGMQHNVWDAAAQSWTTQYSVSGVIFLDTKASIIGGAVLGFANGLLQIGPGYDFTTKKFILLTGFGIKFN